MSQLESSQIEIDYLSALLYSGAICTLPKNDDIFKDIVQRALTLHSDVYSLNDQRRRGALPTDGDATARLDVEALKRLGKSFIPIASASNQANASDGVVEQFLDHPILLPSASFLKRFMFLIFTWIRALPVNKARFNRFTLAMREFSEDIIEKAKEAEKCTGTAEGSSNEGNSPDSFSVAFPAPKKSEVGWQGTYLCEAAAYLHIMVAISMKYQLEALRGENITKYPRFADAAKQVRKWHCSNGVATVSNLLCIFQTRCGKSWQRTSWSAAERRLRTVEMMGIISIRGTPIVCTPPEKLSPLLPWQFWEASLGGVMA